MSSKFFHRKSLSVALVVLGLSFYVTTKFAPHRWRIEPVADEVWGWAAVAAGCSFLLCVLAWLNLIRDVKRGYSPPRCQLAAVILLVALVVPVLVLLGAALNIAK